MRSRRLHRGGDAVALSLRCVRRLSRAGTTIFFDMQETSVKRALLVRSQKARARDRASECREASPVFDDANAETARRLAAKIFLSKPSKVPPMSRSAAEIARESPRVIRLGARRKRSARAFFDLSFLLARRLARAQTPSFFRSSSFTDCGFALPPDAFMT